MVEDDETPIEAMGLKDPLAELMRDIEEKNLEGGESPIPVPDEFQEQVPFDPDEIRKRMDEDMKRVKQELEEPFEEG